MISEETLNKLDDVLCEIVDDKDAGTWADRKEIIEMRLGEDGLARLQEFVAWFAED